MNNGDSFHNGQDNLELQKKNRLGAQDGTVEPADTQTKEPASADGAKPASSEAPLYGTAPDGASLPPHKRPYVNIYAKDGGVTYPSGSREAMGRAERKATETPPEQRTYTNIYAQRAAQRTEIYQPGQYGNTPAPSTVQVGSAPPTDDGTPYYGETADSASYQISDYSDEAAERARKNKFNVASLILGIASFAGNMLCLTCLTPIAAILAIIFGCIGRMDGKFEQKGLIGFILGIVYCAILVLIFLLIFLTMLLAPDGFVM